MEKFTSITFNWILVLFFIALILIVIPATELFSYWDIDWGKVSIDLGYGILIGLIPSVLIGFLAFKEQFNKQLEVLNVSRQVINSGFTEYYDEWDESVLKEKFQTSREIEIYFTYGSTVIKNLNRIISEKLKNEDSNIKIYLMDTENPFVESLGKFWSVDNEKYDAMGIRNKIEETIEEIKSVKRNLVNDGNYKGNLEAYSLNYHPVFFSCYRFDDEIVFVPTKNVERKYWQVPFFVCNKLNSGGIYNWCKKQLEFINEVEDNSALKQVV